MPVVLTKVPVFSLMPENRLEKNLLPEDDDTLIMLPLPPGRAAQHPGSKLLQQASPGLQRQAEQAQKLQLLPAVH